MPVWVQFDELEKERGLKTRRWRAVSVAGATLGFVQWYAPWRRYTFTPLGEEVFDSACLEEIAEFCRTQTVARRREREEERAVPVCLCCHRLLDAEGRCSDCSATKA